MDIIRTDFDARFQPKFCCFYINLDIGSTVVAVVNIILSVLMIYLYLTYGDMQLAVDVLTYSSLKVREDRTEPTRVFKAISYHLSLFLSGLMLYGNIKGNKKLMLPYVCVGFISLGALILMEFVATLTLIFIGHLYTAFINTLVVSIIFFVQLHFWEVVRCRVLDLDHMKQPQTGNPQGGPELPAYGDIQGTTVVDMPGQEKTALPNDSVNSTKLELV